ncbi:MAG: hypothetical protein HW421_1045 [Ignavibacteria bacterium]|nr:hypothetical protein [Ignavibacteria bacterium]
MKILIVDDNMDFCTTIADIVQSCGYQTHFLLKPDEALIYIEKNIRDIAILMLDIEFGPGVELNGMDVLERCRLRFPSLPVVMISGKGSIETAVRATKLGAINFIEKSLVTKAKLQEVLESAMQKYAARNEAKDIFRFLNSYGIIGKSKVLEEIGDNIIRYGRTDLNLLILGETGTGKKLVAQAIHAASRRSKFPFITVDIPNIPRDLFQSELFGHVRGAFSGATENKKGLFHQANKGTIFLDEIGDLPLDLQSNLFIPIEEKQVRKVGSVESEDIDIRFVSATDRDLIDSMRDGKFREQLYHRLRECEIMLPPLRERIEDIPEIVEHYIQRHNEEFNDEKFFSPSATEFLQEQPWRGNIRELVSTLRVVLQTTLTSQIEVADVHRALSKSQTATPSAARVAEPFIISNGTLKEDLARTDKLKIESTLERFGGNVSKSAALLGVSRETLHNKIRRYEINVDSYRIKNRTFSL